MDLAEAAVSSAFYVLGGFFSERLDILDAWDETWKAVVISGAACPTSKKRGGDAPVRCPRTQNFGAQWGNWNTTRIKIPLKGCSSPYLCSPKWLYSFQKSIARASPLIFREHRVTETFRVIIRKISTSKYQPHTPYKLIPTQCCLLQWTEYIHDRFFCLKRIGMAY